MLALDPPRRLPSPHSADDDATALLLQVLDIYAARDLVVILSEAGGRDWSITQLNRIRAGKVPRPRCPRRRSPFAGTAAVATGAL